MNGGIQYEYLMHQIPSDEFQNLKRMVAKLSKEQERKINKK